MKNVAYLAAEAKRIDVSDSKSMKYVKFMRLRRRLMIFPYSFECVG